MNFPTTTVTRISNTQIELYSGCPLAWWFRYVLKIPTLPSIYLILGQVVHAALSDFFMDHILNMEKMSIPDLITYTRDRLELALTETPCDVPRTGKSVEEIIAGRLAGLEEYMTSIGRNLKPIKTEHSIQKRIPNTDIDFLGIVDLITDSHVIDFKVCGKPWNPKKVRESIQPCAYSFLLGRPLNYQFHFISADSPSKILETHITTAAADDYIQRAGLLAMAMNEIAMGRQTPTMSTSTCSSYTCDYCEVCQLHKYGLYEEVLDRSPVREGTLAADISGSY